MSPKHACQSLLLVLSIYSGFVFAGGSQSDYDRAEQLRERFQNKVFRDTVEPHWFDGGNQFWYRVETGPDTHEFILVDAQKGSRGPAFDHARMAGALIEAGLQDISSDRLPAEALEFKPAENILEFQIKGQRWQCDLETYTLTLLSGSTQEESLTAYSIFNIPAEGGSNRETSILFVNQMDRPVELFWMTSNDRQSYGVLQPGGQREQHTYSGHLWLAAETDGRPIAVYQAQEKQGKALIDGNITERPRRRNRNMFNRPWEERQQPEVFASPDGQWQAFVKNDNVWLKKPAGGEEIQLSFEGNAADGYINQFYWSPDSKKLVAVRQKKAQEHTVYLIESSPSDQLQPKLHQFDYLKPGDQVAIDKPHLFDAATQKEIPVSDELFSNPYDVTEIRWQPDSSRFTFRYNQRGHQVLRIVAVEADRGQAQAIIDEQSETFVCYSGKYFCHYLDDSGEIIWMSERDGWNHLYLYDARTGQVKNPITQGPWVVRQVDQVDAEKRQIWFRAGGVYPLQDPYYVHYCRVNFDGSGFVILTEGDGTHTAQFSPDRRYFVDTYSRVDMPPVNELRSSKDGSLLCKLEEADWSRLLEAGWRIPERFTAKGRDGQTDIYGVLIRPTNLDTSQKYPVIEYIYAGPQDSFVPKSFQSFFHVMSTAELGFILVQCDGMGTSNRSKAFHDVCWKNLADAGFPDRIEWTKAAAEKYPYLDTEHVGIYGTSAGGQNAAGALLKFGDFYDAAVSDCGCHDNRMDKIWWNEQWMGWPVGPHYEANSNVTMAKNLKGHLMLIVGEMDRNVDPASTLQVVDALIKADKDFDLLVVPGGGHGCGTGKYGTRRRNDFFVRHLLGVEPRHEP